MIGHRWVSLILFAAALCLGGVAWAAPEDDVKALYDKGVNAYDNDLDFDAARTSFEKALVVIARNPGRVSGATVAKVKIRAGVLYIAVDKDRAKGLKTFIDALKADPTAIVDPNLSNPEIDQVYRDAKDAVGDPGPKPIQGPMLLAHKPPREATTGTPFRIRVELPEGMVATRVVARYRVKGQTKFTELPLEALAANAYQANIPSEKLKKGSLEYYIEAADDSGKVLGLSGSSDAPHLVQVTSDDPADPTGDPNTDPDPEDPDPTDGGEPKNPGKRTFSLVVSGGGVFGTVGGKTDQSGASIKGGVSFPEATVIPELAFYATQKITVGAIGIIQVTGTSGVLVNPEPPKLAGGLRLRYFYAKDQGFRPFFAGDGGFGQFVESFPTSFGGQALQKDSTHNQGPFVGLGWGFENDFTNSVALMVAVSARGYLASNPANEEAAVPLVQGNLAVGLRIGK